jgi:hypothetical protein
LTPSASATTSGDGAISYSVTSAGTTGCSVNATSGVLTYSAAGSCVVRATAAATVRYSQATTDVTFVVTKVTPTLTSMSNIAKSDSDPSFTPSAPSASFGGSSVSGTLSYSSATTSVATVNATTGAVAIVGIGTSVITASFTPTNTDVYNVTIGTYTVSVTDQTAPTVSVSRSGSGALLVGQTASLTFTLSESSSNFISTDVTVSGGLLSSLSGSGMSYAATFTPTPSSSGSASISVGSGVLTDAAGNGNTASSALSIAYDTSSPTVSALSISSNSGSDSTYATGDVIAVNVNFSEAVTVTGVPRLLIRGLSTRYLTYSSGSGTTSITYSYTVVTGDNDSNGIGVATNALALNGGTISDASGNSAVITHTEIVDSSIHKVDAVAPGFSSASVPAAGTSLNLIYDQTLHATTASADAFTVVSDSVSVAVISATVSGTNLVLSLGSSIKTGQVVTVTYTAPISNSGTSNAAVQDLIGNDSQSRVAASVTNNSTVASAPGTPTIGVATMGNGWAYVRFTAPTGAGSSTILDYTITASDGTTQVTLKTATQPIKVTGLENGVAYTFAVKARNSVGYGSESSSSNEVTPLNTSCALGGGCGIGDIGPGGGFVFYVAPTLFTSGPQCGGSCEYLEVAVIYWTSGLSHWNCSANFQATSIAAPESFYRWNGESSVTGATENSIGSGYRNSVIADKSAGRAVCNDQYNSGISSARKFNGGGKSDWYVAASIEFGEIYKVRSLITAGGYGLGGVYKTSQENLNGTFWFFDMDSSNNKNGGSKTSWSNVRPIRAFKSD